MKSDYNISKTKILIVGSASEYGLVSEDKLPLKEDFNGQPISDYGISKLQQTQYALESQKDFAQSCDSKTIQYNRSRYADTLGYW